MKRFPAGAVFLAATLVTAALGPASARATSLAPMTLDEMRDKSEIVATVVVRSVTSAWVGRRIVTFYDVELEDLWRSADTHAPREALVAVLGGEVGGIGQHVAGMPRLDVGERYLLCLGRATGPQGARGIVGLWQGAWLAEERGLVPFSPQGRPVRDARAAVDVVVVQAHLGGAP